MSITIAILTTNIAQTHSTSALNLIHKHATMLFMHNILSYYYTYFLEHLVII